MRIDSANTYIFSIMYLTSSAGAEISDGPHMGGLRRAGPNDCVFVYTLMHRDLSVSILFVLLVMFCFLSTIHNLATYTLYIRVVQKYQKLDFKLALCFPPLHCIHIVIIWEKFLSPSTGTTVAGNRHFSFKIQRKNDIFLFLEFLTMYLHLNLF